LKEENKKRTW